MRAIHRIAQRLRHADHQQQIAVRQPREAGIEGAKDVGGLTHAAAQRRTAEIYIVRTKDQKIIGRHSALPTRPANAARSAIVPHLSSARSVGTINGGGRKLDEASGAPAMTEGATFWATLGIAPSDDARAIRRAYATALKAID